MEGMEQVAHEIRQMQQRHQANGADNSHGVEPCALSQSALSISVAGHGPPRPIVVLYCSTGAGHRAAAAAVEEAAVARGLPVRTLDALSYTPSWFANAYTDAHYRSSAFAPGLYGTAYDLSNHRSNPDGAIRQAADRYLSRRLVATLAELDPLAVIATHFYPSAALRPAYRQGLLTAPILGVITDFAAHAWWAEPDLDAYCVAKGWAETDLLAHGVPLSRIHATGIPVRSAFGEAPRVAPHPRGNGVRVLITSGGHAIGPVRRVLHSFAGVPRAELTVVCGRNEGMRVQVERVGRRLQLDLRVLAFEPQMPVRMAEADVVVGKPGGLTASECLAAGRPMVMVGAVPGQETRNQAWLALHDAGISVAPDAVGRTVAALAEIGAFSTMAENARRLGAPDAAERVLDVALACAARGHAGLRAAAGAWSYGGWVCGQGLTM